MINGNILTKDKSNTFMENKKVKGCLTGIIVFIVLMLIAALLNHVSEEAAKLDWITSTFIGAVILGLILAVIYYKDK